MISIIVNDREVTVDVEDDTPLLWVLRDTLGLTGTKFGCGIAACGACTVHVDGQAVRACVMPVAAVAGKQIKTIEGLEVDGPKEDRPGEDRPGENKPREDRQLHKVQQAWIDHQVPQCGYCQSGMIMAAVALLEKNPNPSDADIDQNMTNICRCGTYQRIRRAVHTAAKE